MRPVERGNVPKEPEGTERVYADHKDARDDLIDRICDCCSYCETGLHSSIAVEHIQPQTHNLGLKLAWTNFLLSCTNCNSTKLTTNVVLNDYFWPHRDNTSRAFVYRVDRAPQVADGLSAGDRAIAQRTLELTGLDKEPGGLRQPTKADRRWFKRREVWGVALRQLQKLRAGEIDREAVMHVALGRGFWSVWMEVFRDDVQMRQVFITAFKVPASCSDAQTNPIHRANGLI